MPNREQNILLIAYNFAPNKRVGALRASYWYKHLGDACNAKVSVITGELEAKGENVHVVKMEGTSILQKFISDEGIVWKKNIKQYIEKNTQINPDLVIITGGPFMHFVLSKWLKKQFSCKVILDYRDPFAINPGFNNGKLKTIIKKWFERGFNRSTDALITVNKHCGDIISNFDSKPNKIVQNGFDESAECNPKPVVLNDQLTFSYAGKFYFPPGNLEIALEKSKNALTYMGGNEESLNPECKWVTSLGFVDYAKAISVVGNSDVGIIQTIGHEFQSTTKIFDYVRCNRAILIISNDKLKYGSIHDELIDYPNVFWAKNDAKDIYRAIEEIKQSTYLAPREGFADKYSRGNQLQYLVELIEEINE